MQERSLDEIHADFDAWWARGEADLKRRKKESRQRFFKHLVRRLKLFWLELLQVILGSLQITFYVLLFGVGCVMGGIILAPKSVEELVGYCIVSGLFLLIFIIFTE